MCRRCFFLLKQLIHVVLTPDSIIPRWALKGLLGNGRAGLKAELIKNTLWFSKCDLTLLLRRSHSSLLLLIFDFCDRGWVAEWTELKKVTFSLHGEESHSKQEVALSYTHDVVFFHLEFMIRASGQLQGFCWDGRVKFRTFLVQYWNWRPTRNPFVLYFTMSDSFPSWIK